MKPIEKGCRAKIVGTRISEGTEVVVGKFLGGVSGWHGNKRWAIDKEIPGICEGILCEDHTHIEERYLQRIDDYDGDVVDRWENCVWRPSKVGVEA